ncbi:uncharacterized protein LOC114575904, partial [Exaiptasia diaphana]|uniref:Major facilitator superfamily (MFS) profile domain-containing protein n=1 Tax=Exaiptasia diaphana TaxID=2652724 RepID=A0A913YSD8_EXADI
MVVAPILNGIGEELSIRTARLADLLTVYPAVVGIFALVAGPISDRVGRRRVLIWGSGIMTGALLLHGIAWDYWSLMSFRAMAGVGGGVLSGAAVALVGDFFPSKKRGWANGWMMTGLAVGQIVGIPAGTLLAGAFGFRMPFMVLAGVSALAVLSVVLWVPFIDPAGERLSLGSAIRGYGALLKRSDAAIASLAFVAVCFSIASFVSYLPAWLETDFGFTP